MSCVQRKANTDLEGLFPCGYTKDLTNALKCVKMCKNFDFER